MPTLRHWLALDRTLRELIRPSEHTANLGSETVLHSLRHVGHADHRRDLHVLRCDDVEVRSEIVLHPLRDQPGHASHPSPQKAPHDGGAFVARYFPPIPGARRLSAFKLCPIYASLICDSQALHRSGDLSQSYSP